MKKFLELIQRMHRERYSVVINRLVAEKIPVAFLSVAPLENAVDTVKDLRAQGLNITTLVTISTPPLSGLELDFEVITLDKFLRLQPRPEYVFAPENTASRVAVKYIPDCKVINLSISLNYTNIVHDYFMSNVVEFQKFYESLVDEESRKTFYGYWLFRVTALFRELFFASTSHYLAGGFVPKEGDVFIDCGTCDGGTASKFADIGCKVYGFEMDKQNFEIAKEVAEKKGFVVENFGLGSYKHEMKYTHDEGNIGGSRFDSGGKEVAQIITLDSYVGENKIPHVDFIKLDVEGAELGILKGATTTILRFKPVLAISVYHKLDDFLVLMNFVKSVRPDYEFALRHYGERREDVPFLFKNNEEENFAALGLEPEVRSSVECVLFAR